VEIVSGRDCKFWMNTGVFNIYSYVIYEKTIHKKFISDFFL